MLGNEGAQGPVFPSALSEPRMTNFTEIGQAVSSPDEVEDFADRIAENNVVVTCDMKLFQNYFSLRRRPTEIILFHRAETCLELFHRLIGAREYFPTCSLSPKYY